MGTILDRINHQGDRLDGWMHRKLFEPPLTHGADARIVPDIRASTAVLAQLEVIDVRRSSVLPYENQFVLAAIESAHPGIALVPHAEVLELAIDCPAGGEHLPLMPPVHTDLMNRAVDGVQRQLAVYRFEKCGEFGLRHLT